MKPQFQKTTFVPGARPVMIQDPIVATLMVHAHDKRGRPLFHMPKPVNRMIHFTSEAAKRKFLKQKNALQEVLAKKLITVEQANEKLGKTLKTAVKEVPIYAGMDRPAFYDFRIGNARRQNFAAARKLLRDFAASKKQPLMAADSREFGDGLQSA